MSAGIRILVNGGGTALPQPDTTKCIQHVWLVLRIQDLLKEKLQGAGLQTLPLIILLEQCGNKNDPIGKVNLD